MTLKLIIINLLTLVRIIGTIVLVPIYKTFGGLYVALLSLICYVTDSIDGLLARRWHASTFFGALFDGVADKFLTIMNFIVLFLMTPYAIIPLIFELAIILTQIIKFIGNFNIQSNIFGKAKVWVLAASIVVLFFISDIDRITFIPLVVKNFINNNYNIVSFNILLPAIIMEIITFVSYVVEIFKHKKDKKIKNVDKELKMPKLSEKKHLQNFKKVWLNPEFYEQHKNDTNLKKLRKL